MKKAYWYCIKHHVDYNGNKVFKHNIEMETYECIKADNILKTPTYIASLLTTWTLLDMTVISNHTVACSNFYDANDYMEYKHIISNIDCNNVKRLNVDYHNFHTNEKPW